MSPSTRTGGHAASRWRLAVLLLGLAAVVVAPILWVTGLSRATGVVVATLGITTGLAGLALPRLSSRAGTALRVVVVAVLVLVTIAGVWTHVRGQVHGQPQGA